MKIIEIKNFQQWEECDNGQIHFTHKGYYYVISCDDNDLAIERMREDEYWNDEENWEFIMFETTKRTSSFIKALRIDNTTYSSDELTDTV